MWLGIANCKPIIKRSPASRMLLCVVPHNTDVSPILGNIADEIISLEYHSFYVHSLQRNQKFKIVLSLVLGDSPASNSLIGNLSFNTLQFINFCLHPCRLCNTSASDLNKIPSINVNDGLETIEWPFRIKDDTFSLIDNIHSGLDKDFETSLKNQGLCYYLVTLSCNYYACSNYISLRFGKQT